MHIMTNMFLIEFQMHMMRNKLICTNTEQQNENRDTNFIDKVDKVQTQARD